VEVDRGRIAFDEIGDRFREAAGPGVLIGVGSHDSALECDKHATKRVRMTSIRHFPATHPLPDWRNFGVMLRVLLGVNLLALLAALVQAPALAAWPARYLELAAGVEPLLLVALALLTLLRDLLWRLPLRLGQG